MRLKWLISVVALVTAVVVGVDLSAQQAPAPQGGAAPQGGGGRAGGGGRGFNLPPLLMTTEAFPDGGIVHPVRNPDGRPPRVVSDVSSRPWLIVVVWVAEPSSAAT